VNNSHVFYFVNLLFATHNVQVQEESMTFYQKTLMLVLSICLVLGLVGCISPVNDDPKDVAGLTSFEFEGYKWVVNAGTATVRGGGESVSVTAGTAYGIAMQLADEEIADLALLYEDGFYVESLVKVDTYKGAGAKNFGLASHITDNNFYYGGINFNGRTQLGTKLTDKGLQCNAAASDSSLWTQTGQYWKLRYEYVDNTIIGYINDIQFVRNSAETVFTIPDGTVQHPDSGSPRPPVNERVDSGSIGFVTSGEAFTVESFKIGDLSEGKAGIKMQSVEFPTLMEFSTPYVMMMTNDYKARAGDDLITVTVAATNNLGGTAAFTVKSSNSAVVKVESTADSFTMTPLKAGKATITVTNSSDSTQTRIFNAIIEEALNFIDTDYMLTENDVYPAPAATGIYEDSRLSITFDSKPTLNEGAIFIYDAEGEEIDVIEIGDDSDTLRDGGSGTFTHKNNFMVQVDGNTVHIIPHFEILELNTEYVIGIPNEAITGTLNGKPFTGFDPENARWTFTTRASAPSAITAIRVGSSDNADYRTLQAALMVAADKAVITMEEGIYREIVYYKGGKAITIEGDTDSEYGANVQIIGINSERYNPGTHTRASFYWSGSDLTLKNVTLQNAFDRVAMNGGGQSEAIFFANGSGKKLVAYNSSFKGQQDTIQTSGKNWFYKCYIEGDTDFMWGTADVALFEECEIKMLDSTSGSAVLFVARVSDASANLIPKGYVLFKSNVSAEHEKSYLARDAGGSDPFYNQAAIIDTTFTGTVQTSLWGNSTTKFIAKDAAGNMNVGWKVYGGDGYPATNIDTNAYGGTITEAVYNKEYNGRKTILNRVFNKTEGTYENASAIWDVSDYEEEFDATEDISEIGEVEAPPTEPELGTTYSYDFESGNADGYSTATFTTKDNLVTVNATAYNGSHGVQFKPGTMTVKVAGSVEITLSACQYANNGFVKVTTTDGTVIQDALSTKTETCSDISFKYTGNATTLTFEFTGDSYLHSLKVGPVTDPIPGATYSYDFETGNPDGYNAAAFTTKDNFVTVNGSSYNGGHGIAFNTNATMTVKVAGAVEITLGACQHANGTVKVTTTDGTVIHEAFNTQVTPCGDISFNYTGDATTLTFVATGSSYFHSLEIGPIAE
jgi:hypothetical protein